MAVSAICPLPDHKVFPKLYLDEDSLSSIKNKIGESNLKRLVVGICIGDADYSLKNRFLRTGKVYTRSWGIENMALLINRLRNTSANNPFTIVLIGEGQRTGYYHICEIIMHWVRISVIWLGRLQ